MAEKAIDIKTQDGTADSHIFYPDGPGSWPAVIFYMDGLGIRPEIQDMARRLASNGYVVLQPNLYYRNGRAPLFDPKTIFEEANRPKLFALVGSLTRDAITRDTTAYLDFLSRQRQVKGSKVGAVGYCMGGALVLHAAAAFPDRIAAGASFHGGNLASDQPDSPHLGAPKIRARLYFGLAEVDEWLPPEQVERLKAAFDKAGTDYRAEVYPGASHGWTVPGLPIYQRDGAERHWDRLLSLFRDTLTSA